jgi:branched-chain amino acid transport system permease protein
MWETLSAVIVYGLVLGSLWLLVSIGFSLICGVLRIFHLGYGITFTMAIYVTWMFLSDFKLRLDIAIALMIVVQLAFSFLIYRGLIQRYLASEEILVTALLLVQIIIEEAINYKYPAITGVSIPTMILTGLCSVGGASISIQLVISAIVAILFTAIITLVLLKSKLGLIVRALSQDQKTAMLMGADVHRLFALAMMISVIPPSICALLLAPLWSVEPYMGSSFFITALLISILGSVGNLKGTIIASYLIGLIHSSVSFLINPRLMNLAALVFTLAFLSFRSEGLTRSESLW